MVLAVGFLHLYNHGLFGTVCRNGEPKEGQIKAACVGDSITYGYGIQNLPKNQLSRCAAESAG